MDNHVLRHLVATIAYRANLAVEGAPPEYPEFDAGHGVRSPRRLLKHTAVVLQHVIRAYDELNIVTLTEDTWDGVLQFFRETLVQVDHVLARNAEPTRLTVDQIVQGPLADALTHVGQLVMLRRLVGRPIDGGSYMQADIHSGILETGLKKES